MAINKGLTSLVNADPNFSNQALENAINDIKNVDKDDGYSWIKSSIDVDTAIEDNTVLTASQKNDLKDTINNQSYLNIGRYLGDLIRHTNTILVCTPDGCYCESHSAKVNRGSRTVFAVGKPVARDRDSADRGRMIQGSRNVFAG